MVHDRHATCSATMARAWAALTAPSGRATSATPARPTIVPTHTRAVQGWPPGRRPSSSRIHSGTVATIRAAIPLGTVCSAHITSELPTERSSTPMRA